MPVNPPTTLETIQAKVRKITRTPSTSQLATADLNNYINTFVAYDMPDHLKLFDLKTTFSFYAQPNQDVYYTDTTNVASTDTLYDFQNKYTSIDNPLFIAGYQSYLSQSREEFFQQWPMINNIEEVGTGDAVTVAFTGTLTNLPFIKNQVTFTSVDLNGAGLTLIDDGAGTLTDPVLGTSSGTINYITGAYSLTWATAPASGQSINAQTIPYSSGRPTTMLFYDNTFTLRPIPDQPYKITFDVYMRPVAIAALGNPQLQDWWQYIAYGAAKKIFEDRMDMESVALIMTEFKQQERLVLRKTIVNQTKERSATIYSQQTSLYGGPFGGMKR